MATTEARLGRLKMWVIVLAGLIVFVSITVPWRIIAAAERDADETQLTVSCQGVENQVIIIEALRSFSGQLGVPWIYPIPEEPSECAGT